MATEIVPFTPDLFPALRRFAERVWTRPRSDAYYRWRYATLPMHRVWLAIRDGEVLAMEAALARPYRIGDEIVEILEVFDWFSRPELRGAGLGVRIQQHLMKQGPCILVGGSEDTRALLPRLRFSIIGQAQNWSMLLSTERAVGAIHRRAAAVPGAIARLAARGVLALPGRRPRRRKVPRGGRAIAVATIGDEVQALYRAPIGYAALPLWPAELLAWLQHGFPAVGHFLPVVFAIDGTVRGFAMARIHPTAGGCDAQLIECFSPRADVDLYTWMVSEMATRVAAFGVGALGACTPCIALQEALRRNGFLRAGESPVQLWWPGHPEPKGPLLIGSNSGDNPLVPFATKWYDDPPPADQQRPTES